MQSAVPEHVYQQMNRGFRQARDGYFRDWYPVALLARYLCGCARRCARSTADDKWEHLAAAATPRTAAALHALFAPPAASAFLALHANHRVVRRDTVEHAARTLLATECELVLDLDLRDWERARPQTRALLCACDDTSACARCWLLVELSAAAMQAWLGVTCGLGPMLVVYSGGKGAHLCFGSAAARRLTPEQRRHLAALFQRAAADANIPQLAAVRAAVMAVWRTRGIEQRALLAPGSAFERYARRELVPQLGAWPATATTSSERWRVLEALLPLTKLERLVWRFAWPQIDADVFVQRAHMSKVPFSLHARTLRIALPLSAASLAACNPATMPTPLALLAAAAAAAEDMGGARWWWQQALAAFGAWLDACGYAPA